MPRAVIASDEEILAFIKQYRAREGMAPSVRDICAHTGHRSTSTMQAILNRLEREGLIERRPGIARSMRVVRMKARSHPL